MRISDIISICLRNLTRRKLRTILTAIGVVIGVCAILVMVSIGKGLESFFRAQMESYGDLTLIEIYNWNSDVPITDEVLADIAAQPGVKAVTPYEYMHVQVNIRTKDERYETRWMELIGVYPEAFEDLGYDFIEGGPLTADDEPFSMVVGEQFAYQFRDTKKRSGNGDTVSPWPDEYGVIEDPLLNPMDEYLKLFTVLEYDDDYEPLHEFEVDANLMGVLEMKDGAWETRNSVFMDVDDLRNYQKQMDREGRKLVEDYRETYEEDEDGYSDVRVKCDSAEDVTAVREYIEGLGYNAYSLEQQLEMFNEQLLVIQLVLGGLAGISLFVAAIGIANTMVMSIIERTREIGIMKVIGAEVGNIRGLFLMEAGLIGLIGGIIGVVFSYGISALINAFASEAIMQGMGMGYYGDGTETLKISIIPVEYAVYALIFAMLIGIIFGYLPANRAVKISALEAIKHD